VGIRREALEGGARRVAGGVESDDRRLRDRADRGVGLHLDDLAVPLLRLAPGDVLDRGRTADDPGLPVLIWVQRAAPRVADVLAGRRERAARAAVAAVTHGELGVGPAEAFLGAEPLLHRELRRLVDAALLERRLEPRRRVLSDVADVPVLE